MSDAKDFDFVDERLGLRYCSYNSEVDQQIFDVAKIIVEARENDTAFYNNEIAKLTGMSPEHVELIQYILAAVRMPKTETEQHHESPFTYGTSPRELFVDNERMAKEFIREFEHHMKTWNEENE